MRKIILGVIALLVLAFIGLFFLPDKKEVLPAESERNEKTVALTEEEVASIQEDLHNEGVGFIYKIHALESRRYLLYTKERNVEYGEDFPADGLVWVEKTKDGTTITPLTSGEYPIRLILNQDRPYFTQDGIFYFVFYEAHGTKEHPRNGKGYVYQVEKETGVKKVYETEGVYHNFALDKQNRMVLVERFELENRNLYPSYFAPYELKYQQYFEGKWKTIQEKHVEPDLKEAYEQLEEKQNKK